MAKKSIAHEIGIKLVNATEKEARQLVLRIHEGLVRDTPVDTGWARANWLLAIGAPILKPAGSKDKLNGSVQAAGVAAILGWKFSQGPAYDTNNVPYMRTLNGGSSRQAPPGFIEKTVQAAVAISNRKKLK